VIPQPDPRDWQIANAQELQITDRQVLALLRDTKKRVDAFLKELETTGKNGVRRAQLEHSRSVLLAEQSKLFERLGDTVAARRASAASRSARLSAAADSALLNLVGKGPQAQFLYDSALQVSQRAIDAALARMRLSALPLSQRIYRSSVWMNGRLSKLINETLATGLNAKEFAKRARDWFNPNTPGGVRYAAMRLARTEINNSFHAISAEKYATTPWTTEVKWNLSKSHPKPDICNAVAKESPYQKASVPARPHPQCMCYITAEYVDEDEFVENFLKGDYDDYLDGELQKNGWDLPEAQQQATLASAGRSHNKLPAPVIPSVQDPIVELTGQAALDAVPKGLFKRGSMTPKQREALKTYESGWFVVINNRMRDGRPVEDAIDRKDEATIALIKEAMEGSITESPIQGWRGMYRSQMLFGDRLGHDLTGFKWHDKGFGSITVNEKITDKFNVEESYENQIKRAFKELADQPNELISLARLRDKLPNISREDLDRKLLELDRSGKIQLESDPHRIALTDRAKAAAIFLGGEDMHLIAIDEKNLEIGPPPNVKMVVHVGPGVGALVTSDFEKGSKENGALAEITLQPDLQWSVEKDNGYDQSGIRQLEVRVDRVGADNVAAAASAGSTERGLSSTNP